MVAFPALATTESRRSFCDRDLVSAGVGWGGNHQSLQIVVPAENAPRNTAPSHPLMSGNPHSDKLASNVKTGFPAFSHLARSPLTLCFFIEGSAWPDRINAPIESGHRIRPTLNKLEISTQLAWVNMV